MRATLKALERNNATLLQWMIAHVTFNPFPPPARIALYYLLKFMDVVAQVTPQNPIEVDLCFKKLWSETTPLFCNG